MPLISVVLPCEMEVTDHQFFKYSCVTLLRRIFASMWWRSKPNGKSLSSFTWNGAKGWRFPKREFRNGEKWWDDCLRKWTTWFARISATRWVIVGKKRKRCRWRCNFIDCFVCIVLRNMFGASSLYRRSTCLLSIYVMRYDCVFLSTRITAEVIRPKRPGPVTGGDNQEFF